MKNKRTKNKPATSLHINIGQLRIDTWNALKGKAVKLADSKKDSTEAMKHLASVENLLKELSKIERYFAFPGLRSLSALKETCNMGEYFSLSRKANEIAQLLVSDAYRHGATLEDVSDVVKSTKKHTLKKTNIASDKNYFEVLFVDDLSFSAEAEIREKLEDIQDKDDQFIYKLVVLPSFQDALIALLFNHNIQSVVVRYGPVFHSKHIIPLIKPFIESVSKIDLSEHLEADLGPLLGQYIRQFRPQLNIYYITDTALTHLKDTTTNNFDRIFYRKEDLQELHLSIIGGVRERYKTPFFLH